MDETHLQYAVVPDDHSDVSKEFEIPDLRFEKGIDLEKLRETIGMDESFDTLSKETPAVVPAGIVVDDAEREPRGTETRNSSGEDVHVPDFDMIDADPQVQMVPETFHHEGRHKTKSCPSCGNPSLYRSKARTAGETLRKKLISKRPYRCHKCGWRGWMSRTY